MTDEGQFVFIIYRLNLPNKRWFIGYIMNISYFNGKTFTKVTSLTKLHFSFIESVFAKTSVEG